MSCKIIPPYLPSYQLPYKTMVGLVFLCYSNPRWETGAIYLLYPLWTSPSMSEIYGVSCVDKFCPKREKTPLKTVAVTVIISLRYNIPLLQTLQYPQYNFYFPMPSFFPNIIACILVMRESPLPTTQFFFSFYFLSNYFPSHTPCR